MRRILLTSTFLLSITLAFSQDDMANKFDFWVGTWDLTWTDGNGGAGKGQNIITRTLDDKVIQENFTALEGQLKGYKGMSISVYNPNQKAWYQTWMDNQGGNINFIGEIDGDRRMFKTRVQQVNGNQVTSRMVFYDITEEGFNWDWEGSQDGGKTWKLNWRIQYKRRK